MNEEERTQAKRIAGNILVQSINEFLDKSKTPVHRGAFEPKLASKPGNSKLFEFGSMRGHITFQELLSDHVEVGIFEDAPEDDRDKSLGHNTGFKGHPSHSKLKKYKREFIPAPNKRFKDQIMEKVESALEPVRRASEQRKKLESELVETILTEGDLLDILGQ